MHGAVAADHQLASEAGVRILQEGGNAVDAAVATSFTLSVVRPFSCGIGGGGFMLIYPPDGEPVALNYRETAPARVGRDFYKNHNSLIGQDAVGIPGTVAGLLAAHARYGRLPIGQVMAPAIEIAMKGFVPDEAYRNGVANAMKALDRAPERLQSTAKAMTRFGQQEALVLRGQAMALEGIAARGRSAFYEGDVGRAIVQSTNSHISLADLSSYQARWETPLVVDIGNELTIVSMPPPSSGGIALSQIMSILHRVGGEALSRDDPLFWHLLVESMKHAFADRAEHLADAAFVDVPIASLLSPAYLDELARRVQRARTAEPSSYGSSVQLPDDSGTSHFCVVDGDGMVVAATETINTSFGSQVLVAPYDFVLNNEMDDFSPPSGTNVYGLQQSDKNLPEPGKRPLSSMAPTIVLRNGVPVFVAGASGGPRIISGVVQVILHAVWFGDSPIVAVSQPRLHHQWMPNRVDIESDWIDKDLVEALELLGHDTGLRISVGIVQAIAIEGQVLKPASDPRKGGVAAGY